MLLCGGLGCILIESFRMRLGELRKFIVTDIGHRPCGCLLFSVGCFVSRVVVCKQMAGCEILLRSVEVEIISMSA